MNESNELELEYPKPVDGWLFTEQDLAESAGFKGYSIDGAVDSLLEEISDFHVEAEELERNIGEEAPNLLGMLQDLEGVIDEDKLESLQVQAEDEQEEIDCIVSHAEDLAWDFHLLKNELESLSTKVDKEWSSTVEAKEELEFVSVEREKQWAIIAETKKELTEREKDLAELQRKSDFRKWFIVSIIKELWKEKYLKKKSNHG